VRSFTRNSIIVRMREESIAFAWGHPNYIPRAAAADPGAGKGVTWWMPSITTRAKKKKSAERRKTGG